MEENQNEVPNKFKWNCIPARRENTRAKGERAKEGF